MIRPTLIVMAKTARVGHGKQRLARDVGRVEAWRINRFLQARTLRAARDPRWDTRLAVSPDRDVNARLAPWPDAPRVSQGPGDLGERLARVFVGRNVAVIGADCPDISRALIWRAFRALRRAPYAIGPTHDGGFWIFAARDGNAARHAFARVRWSSAEACDDLVSALGGAGAEIATLRDVDTGADWRAVQRSLGQRSLIQ